MPNPAGMHLLPPVFQAAARVQTDHKAEARQNLSEQQQQLKMQRMDMEISWMGWMHLVVLSRHLTPGILDFEDFEKMTRRDLCQLKTSSIHYLVYLCDWVPCH